MFSHPLVLFKGVKGMTLNPVLIPLEYHFTTREDMQAAIDSGDFIEWAEYSSNLYGTRCVCMSMNKQYCGHIYLEK